MGPFVQLQLKTTFRACINVFRIFCLFPYYYNDVERRFHSCNASFTYSILYLAGYIYFFGYIKWRIFVQLQQAQYNKFLITSALAAMYVGAITISLVAIWYRHRFLKLFNGFLQLWFRIRADGSIDSKLDRKLLSTFLLKLFVVDGGCVLAISFYGIASGVNISVLYDTFYHVFTFVINATFTNLFTAVSYLGAHYYRMINYRVRIVHHKIKKVSDETSTRKRLVFARLSRELLQLAQWHEEVNALIHEFMDLHSPSLAVMILKNFIIVIGALFGSYVCTVVQVLVGLSANFKLFAFHMLIAGFFFMQFYL